MLCNYAQKSNHIPARGLSFSKCPILHLTILNLTLFPLALVHISFIYKYYSTICFGNTFFKHTVQLVWGKTLIIVGPCFIVFNLFEILIAIVLENSISST